MFYLAPFSAPIIAFSRFSPHIYDQTSLPTNYDVIGGVGRMSASLRIGRVLVSDRRLRLQWKEYSMIHSTVSRYNIRTTVSTVPFQYPNYSIPTTVSHTPSPLLISTVEPHLQYSLQYPRLQYQTTSAIDRLAIPCNYSPQYIR